jgi:hypothetical protein
MSGGEGTGGERRRHAIKFFLGRWRLRSEHDCDDDCSVRGFEVRSVCRLHRYVQNIVARIKPPSSASHAMMFTWVR